MPRKRHILIVEDEPEIAELVQLHLDRSGFATRIATTGRAALDMAARAAPDLVVLDLMLPDISGLEVCRALKWNERTRHILVLMLSARGEETDIVSGLELGADDYVTKPFSHRVLLARVGALIRRTMELKTLATAKSGLTATKIELLDGAMTIDISRHEVLCRGVPLELTPIEFGIIRCLAEHPGFVRTRDQIIRGVWGEETVITPRTIDVHMTSLRRKLGSDGAVLQTVRGIGYRIAETVE